MDDLQTMEGEKSVLRWGGLAGILGGVLFIGVFAFVGVFVGADRIDDPTKCEDATLVGALKKIKAEVPDQRNITVQCEDGVKYNDLIRVIDVCNLKDSTSQPMLFPDVAVSAVG